MNFRKIMLAAAVVFTLACFCSMETRSAQAQSSYLITKTYKVQVKYWFFDTDYYYWSTVLDTNDRSEAELLYDILVWAKENNKLNEFAPNSYWRYIAVDVRLKVEYHYPDFQPIYPSYNRNLSIWP